MGTVVQTNYKDRILRGRIGTIADEVGAEIGTRICETAAGIGFGLAVSQGTGEKGAVIGGSNFIGVSLCDVTLNGVPLDPLNDGTQIAADKIGQYFNFGVASRGHIWVEAGMLVAPGNALAYNTTTGEFTTGTGGTASHGKVTFTSNPAAEDTITFSTPTGSVVTFKASGATGLQSNIGETLNQTLVNLAAMLNASADANLTKLKYQAYPTGDAYELHWASETAGANDAWTAATTVTGATVTAASGGSAASTAIVGGYWKTAAIAGEPAIISLGIQQ